MINVYVFLFFVPVNIALGVYFHNWLSYVVAGVMLGLAAFRYWIVRRHA